MESLTNDTSMNKTKNKGEWTELLVFIKLLLEQKISLADADLVPNGNYFDVTKISTHNLDYEYLPLNNADIQVITKKTQETRNINIESLISPAILNDLITRIKNGNDSINKLGFEVIQNELGFTIVKGGNSSQKADILLDIKIENIIKKEEGFGIKSYLGNSPTLLNASGTTNFIFEVENLHKDKIDEINAIDTKTKLKDRLAFIEAHGGKLNYIGPEKDTMDYNLRMVDSNMPQIIGHVLLAFYKKRISSIREIVDYLHEKQELYQEIRYPDKAFLESKIKKLLVDNLLGFFAGTKWDGSYEANGTIIMKKTGDLVAFHLIDLESLKSYLYNHIKLDTPSTTRHRFGKLILEKDNKLYFKLNLQLGF